MGCTCLAELIESRVVKKRVHSREPQQIVPLLVNTSFFQVKTYNILHLSFFLSASHLALRTNTIRWQAPWNSCSFPLHTKQKTSGVRRRSNAAKALLIHSSTTGVHIDRSKTDMLKAPSGCVRWTPLFLLSSVAKIRSTNATGLLQMLYIMRQVEAIILCFPVGILIQCLLGILWPVNNLKRLTMMPVWQGGSYGN